MTEQRDDQQPSQRVTMMRFAGAGIEIAGACLVGALIGHAADRFLLQADRPWGLLIGGLIGFTAGMAKLIRMAMTFYR